MIRVFSVCVIQVLKFGRGLLSKAKLRIKRKGEQEEAERTAAYKAIQERRAAKQK